MTIERRNFPQFFITAPSPCPYLPDQQERKVFTHLVGTDASALNSQLSQGGFRRSQNIAYRPACDKCKACVSIRVPVDNFAWSKSFRRTLRINSDLTVHIRSARATSEHYSLFREYVDTRHSEGGMADMTVLDFAAMIDETTTDSQLVEFRLDTTPSSPGELVGAALVDKLADGYSMIYSFYNPTYVERSLGTLMILKMIQQARHHEKKYLYLGYWISGSRKMAYKSRFLPQQRLGPDGWTLVGKT
jgi:leucyl-tRNA---protein transferase